MRCVKLVQCASALLRSVHRGGAGQRGHGSPQNFEFHTISVSLDPRSIPKLPFSLQKQCIFLSFVLCSAPPFPKKMLCTPLALLLLFLANAKSRRPAGEHADADQVENRLI